MPLPMHEQIERVLWAGPGEQDPAPMKWLRVLGRYVYAVVRDLADGQLTLRAMSLVYTTLLSVVPLLAFSFSVLKGFGVHQKVLQPQLSALMAPLGEKGAELTLQIIGFVDNVRGSVLGGVGLVLLVYTAVSMIQKVEDSFNHVWQVQQSRSLARRFSDYLSVILIGPVLMFAATGLIATAASSTIAQKLAEIEPFGSTMIFVGRMLPFVMVTAVFTFLYAFIPNTKVKFGAALAGALIAGLGWALAGKLFASFVVGSAKYSAIYSSFAIAIIALIWIYLSWLILLIGAQLSFYVQFPRLMREGRKRLAMSPAQVEQVALQAMYRVAIGHRDGEPPDVEGLARALGIPGRVLDDIVDRLEAARVVARTEGGALVPAREAGRITVVDVLSAVRGRHGHVPDRPVDAVLEALRCSAAEGAGRTTLGELICGEPEKT
jgi:membrane protein